MKQKTKIITLSIIIILAILFIVALLVVKPAIKKREMNLVNAAVEYTVVSIMNEANNCNIVPLTYNNQTINLFSVECLQQTSSQVNQSQ